MILQVTDHSEVWFILEKADALFSDFSIDHIVAFDHEDDFCLVVYTAGEKRFHCFIAQAYRQDTDALGELIGEIQELETVKWKDEAVKIVENKLHSKNNSRFFFDAH